VIIFGSDVQSSFGSFPYSSRAANGGWRRHDEGMEGAGMKLGKGYGFNRPEKKVSAFQFL